MELYDSIKYPFSHLQETFDKMRLYTTKFELFTTSVGIGIYFS